MIQKLEIDREILADQDELDRMTEMKEAANRAAPSKNRNESLAVLRSVIRLS
jgi:hypothetical protein